MLPGLVEKIIDYMLRRSTLQRIALETTRSIFD